MIHGGDSLRAIDGRIERLGDVIAADVLDAWYPPSPAVTEALQAHLPDLLRTSPPVQSEGLIQAIAQNRGVAWDQLLAGAGSSALIFSCVPRLCGKRVLLLDPMYGEYVNVCRDLAGAEVFFHPLHEEERFAVDPHALIAQAKRVRPDSLILVNPNSPTGQAIPRPDMRRILDALPDTIVLVDETYIDYGGDSLENLTGVYANLVVVKSMSKVYALSGARVAYLCSSPERVQGLRGWIPPWAVSFPAQVAAQAALSDPAWYAARWLETHLLRSEAIVRLHSIPVIDGVANFYLVTVRDAAKATAALAGEGIYVRNCESLGASMGNRFLRVTVRTHSENLRISSALCNLR